MSIYVNKNDKPSNLKEKSIYRPIYDNKKRLTYYLKQKITYRNLGNIDYRVNEDWVKKISSENRLLSAKEIMDNISYTGMGYQNLEISEKRVKSIKQFEDNLWENKDKLTVFKVDITDLTGELDDVSFKSVLRLFDNRCDWNPLLGENVYKRAGVIECGDNGNVGMHLYIFSDVSSYYNHYKRNDIYIDKRNFIVKNIVECIRHHAEIRHCAVNVSESIPDKLVVFTEHDTDNRNNLLMWLSYLCKINSMTRGWLMSGKKRLFTLSHRS